MTSKSFSILAYAQGSGRLVHHKDACAGGKRLSDLYCLLSGNAEIPTPRFRVEANTKALEERTCLPSLLVHGEEAKFRPLPSKEDVFSRRQIGDEVKLLIDDGNAELLGFFRNPIATSLPSSWITPASGVMAPASVLISVLFPAPFSPIKACTSPR